MISKETFCKALRLIQEQEKIYDTVSKALELVGNGHMVFGTENKYREALLMVLGEAVDDRYDYIGWWLYEGAEKYEVWSSDESQKWELKDPEALYDFIISIHDTE